METIELDGVIYVIDRSSTRISQIPGMHTISARDFMLVLLQSMQTIKTPSRGESVSVGCRKIATS